METLVLETNICSDGICCFSVVAGEKAAHSTSPLKLIVEQRIRPNPKAPLFTNYNIFQSCADLKVQTSYNADDGSVSVSLRCSVYGRRPKPCKEYPTGKRYHGPCLYNELLAPEEYKAEIYQYDWSAFYGIENKPEIVSEVLGEEAAQVIWEKVKTKEIRKKKLGKIFRKKEYILLPVPISPEVLLVSKEHQLITSVKHAFQMWPRELNRRKAQLKPQQKVR